MLALYIFKGWTKNIILKPQIFFKRKWQRVQRSWDRMSKAGFGPPRALHRKLWSHEVAEQSSWLSIRLERIHCLNYLNNVESSNHGSILLAWCPKICQAASENPVYRIIPFRELYRCPTNKFIPTLDSMVENRCVKESWKSNLGIKLLF